MLATSLGRLLVNEGLLSEADRTTITKTCGHGPWAFARGVLALGLLDEDELTAVIADGTQFKIAARDLLSEHEPSVFQSVDPALVAKLEVFPLHLVGTILTVAAADPLDKNILNQLAFFTGLQVKPVVAPLSLIRRCLHQVIEGYEPSITELEEFIYNHAENATRFKTLQKKPFLRRRGRAQDSGAQVGHSQIPGEYSSSKADDRFVNIDIGPDLRRTRRRDADLDSLDEFGRGDLSPLPQPDAQPTVPGHSLADSFDSEGAQDGGDFDLDDMAVPLESLDGDLGETLVDDSDIDEDLDDTAQQEDLSALDSESIDDDDGIDADMSLDAGDGSAGMDMDLSDLDDIGGDIDSSALDDLDDIGGDSDAAAALDDLDDIGGEPALAAGADETDDLGDLEGLGDEPALEAADIDTDDLGDLEGLGDEPALDAAAAETDETDDLGDLEGLGDEPALDAAAAETDETDDLGDLEGLGDEPALEAAADETDDLGDLEGLGDEPALETAADETGDLADLEGLGDEPALEAAADETDDLGDLADLEGLGDEPVAAEETTDSDDLEDLPEDSPSDADALDLDGEAGDSDQLLEDDDNGSSDIEGGIDDSEIIDDDVDDAEGIADIGDQIGIDDLGGDLSSDSFGELSAEPSLDLSEEALGDAVAEPQIDSTDMEAEADIPASQPAAPKGADQAAALADLNQALVKCSLVLPGSENASLVQETLAKYFKAAVVIEAGSEEMKATWPEAEVADVMALLDFAGAMQDETRILKDKHEGAPELIQAWLSAGETVLVLKAKLIMIGIIHEDLAANKAFCLAVSTLLRKLK